VNNHYGLLSLAHRVTWSDFDNSITNLAVKCYWREIPPLVVAPPPVVVPLQAGDVGGIVGGIQAMQLNDADNAPG
jgi:hypothetical protein